MDEDVVAAAAAAIRFSAARIRERTSSTFASRSALMLFILSSGRSDEASRFTGESGLPKEEVVVVVVPDTAPKGETVEAGGQEFPVAVTVASSVVVRSTRSNGGAD